MLALAVVLAFLLAVILFFLLSPLELRLDTRSDVYALRWRGLGGARLTGPVDDPVLRWRVLGWGRDLHLLDALGAPVKPEKPEKKKKPGRAGGKRPRWLTRQFVLRLLRTFRVRRFRLFVDTGDYVWNAYLFPLFGALAGGRRELGVNFQGRNELVLVVTNRLGRVAWVFIRGFISSK